uniref:uncharacterized protein LOC120348418 isoform X2 n=1 Tax=Styela clava TaxID=7725 RepID=UPI0019394DB9|nr:uncharacterized protein LOC120348418 isoform X2 [Styela clava]
MGNKNSTPGEFVQLHRQNSCLKVHWEMERLEDDIVVVEIFRDNESLKTMYVRDTEINFEYKSAAIYRVSVGRNENNKRLLSQSVSIEPSNIVDLCVDQDNGIKIKWRKQKNENVAFTFVLLLDNKVVDTIRNLVQPCYQRSYKHLKRGLIYSYKIWANFDDLPGKTLQRKFKFVGDLVATCYTFYKNNKISFLWTLIPFGNEWNEKFGKKGFQLNDQITWKLQLKPGKQYQCSLVYPDSDSRELTISNGSYTISYEEIYQQGFIEHQCEIEVSQLGKYHLEHVLVRKEKKKVEKIEWSKTPNKVTNVNLLLNNGMKVTWREQRDVKYNLILSFEDEVIDDVRGIVNPCYQRSFRQLMPDGKLSLLYYIFQRDDEIVVLYVIDHLKNLANTKISKLKKEGYEQCDERLRHIKLYPDSEYKCRIVTNSRHLNFSPDVHSLCYENIFKYECQEFITTITSEAGGEYNLQYEILSTNPVVTSFKWKQAKFESFETVSGYDTIGSNQLVLYDSMGRASIRSLPYNSLRPTIDQSCSDIMNIFGRMSANQSWIVEVNLWKKEHEIVAVHGITGRYQIGTIRNQYFQNGFVEIKADPFRFTLGVGFQCVSQISCTGQDDVKVVPIDGRPFDVSDFQNPFHGLYFAVNFVCSPKRSGCYTMKYSLIDRTSGGNHRPYFFRMEFKDKSYNQAGRGFIINHGEIGNITLDNNSTNV